MRQKIKREENETVVFGQKIIFSEKIKHFFSERHLKSKRNNFLVNSLRKKIEQS